MKSIAFYILVLLCGIYSPIHAQPGTIQMTPLGDLDLQPTALEVPDKFAGLISDNLTVWLPEGFTAKVFHIGGLSKPRFMSWGHDSTLYISDKNLGQIIALPDNEKDGVADDAIVAASGFSKPHDVRFYKGSMYVADEVTIWKMDDPGNDGIYEQKTAFISNIAGNAPNQFGGHDTRTITFDSLNEKMYLSIGSRFNVAREAHRAIIEEYNADGTGRRIFASGIRNAVGMTIRPSTGRLWATNNGSDWQGDDIPPEWIDIIRDNGFYGHPFAHSNQVFFNFNANSDYAALLPITSADEDLVEKQFQPAGLVQAHSAPMAIQFANDAFPEQYRNGAFVAFRGSWNRSIATGYKIVYLHFDSPADTTANYVADFVTGFLTNAATNSRWGRPVGLAADNRGNLYISSDANTRFVMIVSPPVTTDIDEPDNTAQPLTFALKQNYPNPFNPTTTIRFALQKTAKVKLIVYDVLGKEVAKLVDTTVPAGEHAVTFDGSFLATGMYIYRLHAGNKTQTKKMMLIK